MKFRASFDFKNDFAKVWILKIWKFYYKKLPTTSVDIYFNIIKLYDNRTKTYRF